jgi:Lsr2
MPTSAPSAAIREWAAGEGIDVPSRGRIPEEVSLAYDEAHPVAAPVAEAEPEPLPQDPDPKRGEGFIRSVVAPKRTRIRVTATVRKDVRGKVALMLALPAGILAQRDQICGPVLQQQVPDISEALTDIICDSPDLVSFFTSTAGGYMKWLTLAVALQPVAVVAYHHHVAHSVGNDAQEQQDWSMYGAPEFTGG